jgi:hypothetical protein
MKWDFKNYISVSNESLQNYYYISNFDFLYYSNPLTYRVKMSYIQNGEHDIFF